MASFSGGGGNYPPLTPPILKAAPNNQKFWVAIETVDESIKATDIPIIFAKKFIEQFFGTAIAKPTRDGRLLVEAINKNIALKAMNVTSMYGKYKIRITAMESMNNKVGSIFGRELLNNSIEEITGELKNQRVVKVERAQTMKDGELVANGLHILTFDTDLPTKVHVGYMEYNVRKYYPRPLRCGKCCIFGHSKSRCQEKEMACRWCAEVAHQGTPCKGKYCRNCKDGAKKIHGTFDKECPMFETEVAIVRLKIDNNWSYGQARAFLMKETQKAADTHKSSILETMARNARQRAEDSANIKEERLKAEFEIAQLEKEVEELRATTLRLITLRNDKMKLLQLQQQMQDKQVDNHMDNQMQQQQIQQQPQQLQREQRLQQQQPQPQHKSQPQQQQKITNEELIIAETQNTPNTSKPEQPEQDFSKNKRAIPKSSEPMETETNLKRKGRKIEEHNNNENEEPTQKIQTPVTIRAKNFKYLQGWQQEKII